MSTGLPVEFHPDVRRETDNSFAYYERKQPGLGSTFLRDVERTIAAVEANPVGYGFAERDVREALLGRFPFAVYYRVLTDRIRVLAVHHTARDPSVWQARN